MKPKRMFAALALALMPLASTASAQEIVAASGARIGTKQELAAQSRSNYGRSVQSRGYSRSAQRSSGYGRSGYGRGGRVISRPYDSRRSWVPGHYEQVARQVWVPARTERIWIEPVYELRCDRYGNQVRVLVRAGYWDEICHPGYYETRYVRTWIPGTWIYR